MCIINQLAGSGRKRVRIKTNDSIAATGPTCVELIIIDAVLHVAIGRHEIDVRFVDDFRERVRAIYGQERNIGNRRDVVGVISVGEICGDRPWDSPGTLDLIISMPTSVLR